MPSNPQLQPGDTVVPLAALAVKSSAVTGAITLGQLANRADLSGLVVFLCVPFGLVIGGILGYGLARLAYPAVSGHVKVVKVGKSALFKTLPAALFPALAVAAIFAASAPMVLGGPPAVLSLLVAGLSAIAAGLVFGLGSALA